MSELSWDWPEIACVLMWKLAPQGTVITRKDLAALPQDRVLVEVRDAASIRFSWLTVKEAQGMRKPLAERGEKAAVSQLQGRWQKIACVLLWKLARGKLVILTQIDRDAVPADKTLLAHGHRDDVEYRFLPRSEAARIQKWERDQRGKNIMERL